MSTDDILLQNIQLSIWTGGLKLVKNIKLEQMVKKVTNMESISWTQFKINVHDTSRLYSGTLKSQKLDQALFGRDTLDIISVPRYMVSSSNSK